MIKSKLTLLVTLSSILLGGQRQSVLFIGNSLTFFHDMPDMVQHLADSSGKALDVDQMTMAGLSLRILSSLPVVHEKIAEKKWDMIVLQSNDITAFPGMYPQEIVLLNDLKARIYKNNPETQIIYQMVYGLEGGVTVQGEGYYSYLDYMIKIFDGTLYIAETTELLVAPAGWAWQEALQRNPQLQLFDIDGAHPSYDGSYLTACVFYCILLEERVSGNTYIGALEPEEARFFQDVASDVVMNAPQRWGLTSSAIKKTEICPETFQLKSYPNPFNSETVIQYQVDDGPYELFIVNMLGQRVLTLDRGIGSRGEKEIRWNGRGKQGSTLPSGIYSCTLNCGHRIQTRRIVLMK